MSSSWGLLELDPSCEELSSVEGFDPVTGCWEVLPSMNTRRANAGVVASEGVKAADDNFD